MFITDLVNDNVLKVQDEEDIAALDWLDLRAIREAFERAGIEFGQDSPDGLRRTMKAGSERP